MRASTVGIIMNMSRIVLAALLAFAVSGFEARAGESLLDRCWTPQALAGTDKEISTVRAPHKLDLAALRKDLPPAATPVPPELRGSIRGVTLPPGEKLIALTFDLCETDGSIAGYDGRVVDLLRAQGVKATFFAGGKWMETHKERAQQLIADPNFEIGSHGLRHLDLSRIKPETMTDEIVLTQAAYARARSGLMAKQCAANVELASPPPERMRVMRFPFGTCDAKSLEALADNGFLAIQWDVVTGDPDPHITAKGIANNILSHAHPGAIIVMHANGRGKNTAAALATAIPKLKAEGYSFVTVSELIAAGKPVIAANCYLNRPGDSLRHVAKLQPRRQSDDIWSKLGIGH